MFETVSPTAGLSRDRRVFYESLPLSVALHVAGLAITAMSITTEISFPSQPPHFAMAYLMSEGSSGVQPPPALAPAPVVRPSPLAKEPAPTTIPTQIQPAQARAPQLVTEGARSDSGSPEGEAAGAPTGIAGGILMGDGRIHFGRGGLLPMTALSLDYPAYPEAARHARLEADVLIRYVVGTDGLVKEVMVVERGISTMFDDAAIDAVRRWRFEPLIYQGQAREVMHEVSIAFRLDLSG